MKKGMKIVEFRAENFKKIKLVEFKPDSTVQIIAGDNAQGKTSIMDAPFAALAGGTAGKQIVRPIRDGEEQAEVRLDLGDIVVTRTWLRGKPSTLKVESALGAEFKSPQTMLDTLLGRFSFDPLEFTRLDAKKQVNALMDIAGLSKPLDDLSAKRDELYAARTDIGRKVKEYEGAVSQLGEDEPAPEEAVSVSDLLSDFQRATDHRTKSQNLAVRSTEAKDVVIQLKLQLLEATKEQDRAQKEFDDFSLLEYQDPIALKEQIDNAEELNNKVRRNETRLLTRSQLEESQKKYESFNTEIAKIDKEKTELVANADFPIARLGFSDTGVTYKDIELSECSSAEQILISLNIAMALNPVMRVIRILDGSLLDDASMKLIFEEAANKDYQVWIERVGDADEMALIIEDGEVKE